MKVAIYGQYYQNSTEPIIKDIFLFFKSNNVEMVIESEFLKMLYEKQLIKKEYKTGLLFNGCEYPRKRDIFFRQADCLAIAGSTYLQAKG